MPQSLNGTYRFCNQPAGFLRKQHGQCRDPPRPGHPGDDPARRPSRRAPWFNETTLRAIAQRLHATDDNISQAIAEVWAQGIEQATAGGILTQGEEDSLRTFRDQRADHDLPTVVTGAAGLGWLLPYGRIPEAPNPCPQSPPGPLQTGSPARQDTSPTVITLNHRSSPESEQRRRNREKRSRRLRKERNKCRPDPEPPTVDSEPDNGEEEPVHPDYDRDLLAYAIRATGFLPMILVVAFLSSHTWYLTSVPQWAAPLLQKQVAVLTLTAGHAALVGLLLNNRGRFNWSTYAMLIAAVATATAGHRSIGDSTVGHTVTVMLFVTTIPAVWAERLSSSARRLWNVLWSKKGITVMGVAAVVILVAFNQARDENYIRNWLIIPSVIFIGSLVAANVCWAILKLSIKWAPVLFRPVRTKMARIWRNIRNSGSQG